MIQHIPIDPFDDSTEFEVPIQDRERQERDEAIIGFFENAFHVLNAYQIHQRNDVHCTLGDLRMSTRAMAMAVGFRLVAGADGPAELAKDCGVSKQALGKCLNHFIEQLKLSPLPFQRKQEARQNMAEARKRQVVKA